MFGVQYAGNLVAPRLASFQALQKMVWGMTGLAEGTPYLVWEEVKFHREEMLMINEVKLDRQLQAEQLQDGDIVIVQEELPEVRTPHAA